MGLFTALASEALAFASEVTPTPTPEPTVTPIPVETLAPVPVPDPAIFHAAVLAQLELLVVIGVAFGVLALILLGILAVKALS